MRARVAPTASRVKLLRAVARGVGYNFLYQDQGTPFRRAPAAARAVASCLRPGSVSARVGPTTNGEPDPGGKLKAMPPAGHLGDDLTGKAADRGWWRVNSDHPRGRHPEGRQTAAGRTRPSRFAVGFAEPCTADHRPAEQSLPPTGMIRTATLLGLRPSPDPSRNPYARTRISLMLTW